MFKYQLQKITTPTIAGKKGTSPTFESLRIKTNRKMGANSHIKVAGNSVRIPLALVKRESPENDPERSPQYYNPKRAAYKKHVDASEEIL